MAKDLEAYIIYRDTDAIIMIHESQSYLAKRNRYKQAFTFYARDCWEAYNVFNEIIRNGSVPWRRR